MKKLVLLALCVCAWAQQTFPPSSGTGVGGASGSYSAASATYTGTSYLPPGGGATANATEAAVQGVATVAGTISNFSVNLSAAPGAGNSLAFTWRKGGADQTVTCTVANTATSCSDTTHNFPVVANDLLDMKVVATGTPAATGIVLQWATPGQVGPGGPAGYAPQYIVAAGAPSNAVGNNGDMYINSSTGDLYGPKSGSVWGSIQANIKGPTGNPGYAPQYVVAAGAPSNASGNNGDMYINSSTGDLYGPKSGSVWGSIQANIKGSPGSPGAAGANGTGFVYRGPYAGRPGSPQVNDTALFTDATSTGNCGSSGGSSYAICSWTGSAWSVSGGGSGSGGMSPSGPITTNAIVTAAGPSSLQTPSAASLDSGGNLTTPGGVSTGNGTSKTGYTCWTGQASATCQGFSVPDSAGVTSIVYLLPATGGTSGQVLADNGSTTCPTLPAGAPTTCHALVWTTPNAGTVTQVTFPTIPSWLTAAVAANTTTPSISISPTAAQSSHQVIGTCGVSTTFGPCTLTESDILLANNTTNDANTSRHGFMPILPGNSTLPFCGDGTFSTNCKGSGGGGGSGNPYSSTFSCTSSPTTITAATHGQGLYPFIKFRNSSNAPVAVDVVTLATNGDLTVSCGTSQTITAYISGAKGSDYNASGTFSTATSIPILHDSHGFSSTDLDVQTWDNASPRHLVGYDTFSVSSSTYTATLTFGAIQSGLWIMAHK